MPKNTFDESFKDARARKEKGQRGKSAEDAVRKLLAKKSEEHSGFEFLRLPDSRAAGRPMPAQPCDYLVFSDDGSDVGTIALEVKQISKGSRLAKAALPQLAWLHRLTQAGVACVIVVFLAETGDWWLADANSLGLEEKSWKVDGDVRWKKFKLEELF